MHIAQISDLHLGMDPPDAGQMNARRLRAVLADIFARDVTPDLLLVSGDLTDHGSAEGYAEVRTALADVPVPVHLMLGNHDDRAAFGAAFPETPMADGFVQYAVELPELRILMLDTLEVGRHGGGFCATRAAWLEARLAEAPDRPTMVVCHHPPFATGIDWMTSDADDPWRVRLEAALGAGNVLGVFTGHIHRAMLTMRAGRVLASCPPVAPQLALCFAPITPEPDDRPMISAAPPGYLLHQWSEGGLLTHVCFADEADVIVGYTPAMQPFIAEQIAERRSPA